MNECQRFMSVSIWHYKVVASETGITAVKIISGGKIDMRAFEHLLEFEHIHEHRLLAYRSWRCFQRDIKRNNIQHLYIETSHSVDRPDMQAICIEYLYVCGKCF
jgi:hypothetical protein